MRSHLCTVGLLVVAWGCTKNVEGNGSVTAASTASQEVFAAGDYRDPDGRTLRIDSSSPSVSFAVGDGPALRAESSGDPTVAEYTDDSDCAIRLESHPDSGELRVTQTGTCDAALGDQLDTSGTYTLVVGAAPAPTHVYRICRGEFEGPCKVGVFLDCDDATGANCVSSPYDHYESCETYGEGGPNPSVSCAFLCGTSLGPKCVLGEAQTKPIAANACGYTWFELRCFD